jgi:hypothetical protein
MVDLNLRLPDIAATTMFSPSARDGSAAALVQWAHGVYQQHSARGSMRRAWAALRRQRRQLWRLQDLKPKSEHFAGLQTVEIDRIRGSEGRVVDFDIDFFPIGHHNRSRWTGIAMARQQGIKMPPVTLIQAGDLYFVRDGHHRISVARAFGQTFIEAEVTVWQVAGPLPWEAPAPARASQPALA